MVKYGLSCLLLLHFKNPGYMKQTQYTSEGLSGLKPYISDFLKTLRYVTKQNTSSQLIQFTLVFITD